jgi:hypothetical protein
MKEHVLRGGALLVLAFAATIASAQTSAPAPTGAGTATGIVVTSQPGDGGGPQMDGTVQPLDTAYGSCDAVEKASCNVDCTAAGPPIHDPKGVWMMIAVSCQRVYFALPQMTNYNKECTCTWKDTPAPGGPACLMCSGY